PRAASPAACAGPATAASAASAISICFMALMLCSCVAHILSENRYPLFRDYARASARLRPDVDQRGLAGFHGRHRLLDRGPELLGILDRPLRPPAHGFRELVILDVGIHDAGANRAEVVRRIGIAVAEARDPLHMHQFLMIAAVVVHDREQRDL